VGGVSGRPTQEDIWSDPGAACDFATVKGTLIVRMPSSFAGWRWSGGLGRLVYPRNGSLPFRVSAPATRGVPWFAKEGNVLSACAIKATQPFERQLSLLTRSVTRPSLGPRARARRSSLTSPVKADEGDAFGEGSRLGKPGNRRNQHRLLVSRTKRGSTRIPTLARGTRGCVRKGRRLRPPSLRGSRESRSECPHVVCSCRSRQRRHLVSNRLTCSTLQKGTRRE
jgi:hypothetical protein